MVGGCTGLPYLHIQPSRRWCMWLFCNWPPFLWYSPSAVVALFTPPATCSVVINAFCISGWCTSLMLDLGAMSHIMLNGGVTKAIPLTRSLWQGCQLNPSLFAIATHPNTVKMHEFASYREIIGLVLPPRKQLIVKELVDDSILFLKRYLII